MSEQTTGQAAQALATIIKFPAIINNVAKSVAGTALGPWTVDVHCKYDSGCKSEHFVYTVSFSTKALTDALAQAEAHARTFFTSFAPVTEWLKSTLPTFSVTFKKTSAVIVKILNQVPAGGKLSPAQKHELIIQLGFIYVGLNKSKELLQKGSIALSTYETQQSGLAKNVSNVKDTLVDQVQDALNKMKESVVTQKCGHGDAQNQFNVIQGQFSATVNVFNAEFAKLTQQSTNADNAVNTIIGIVTDFVFQVKNIIDELNEVESGDQSTFLKKIEVLASTDLWDTLAEEAESAFSQNAQVLEEAHAQISLLT